MLTSESTFYTILTELFKEHTIKIVLFFYFLSLINNASVITIIPNIYLLVIIITKNHYPKAIFIKYLMVY